MNATLRSAPWPLHLLAILAGAGLTGSCSLPPVGWDDSPLDDTGERPPTPEGTITGRVVDSDGVPMSGVWVTAAPHGFEAVTGKDGTFTLSHLPPGDYSVVAGAVGYEPGSLQGLVVSEGASAHAEIVLVPKVNDLVGHVTVSVLGPDGLPLEGARVQADSSHQAVTDPTGLALLDGLAGQQVEISVSFGDGGTHWPRTRSFAVPALGNVVTEVSISARPPADSPYIDDSWCGFCHVAEGEAWSRSRHGNALSETLPGTLLNDFTSGVAVDLGNGATAILSLPETTPVVTLVSASAETLDMEVSGIIGDPLQSAIPWADVDGQGYPLPFSWVAANPQYGDWPDAEARIVPWEVGTWFDAAGNFAFEVAHPEPPLSAEARCFGCHTDGYQLTVRSDGGVDMLATAPGNARWAHAGVGCQTCHGPGNDHVANSSGRIDSITQPQMLDRERIDEICAQCHSSRISVSTGLPFAWSATLGAYQPGLPLDDFTSPDPHLWSNGTAAAPNQQVDEMALTGHGVAGVAPLLCIDCHDPHGSALGSDGLPTRAMLRLENADNTLCNSCHLGLTWADDLASMEEHARCGAYDPTGPTLDGRCSTCHMPGTSTVIGFSAESGAGDVASHSFLSFPPQQTVDAFTAAGAKQLPPGSFPIHGCAECHTYNAWLGDSAGSPFVGTWGDPTLKATHQAYQETYEGVWP